MSDHDQQEQQPSMAPPLDYHDPAAIMEALQSLNLELAASGRGFPSWFAAVREVMERNIRLSQLMGLPAQQVAEDRMMTHFLLGILAGREGWPLVGDPLRPVPAPASLIVPGFGETGPLPPEGR